MTVVVVHEDIVVVVSATVMLAAAVALMLFRFVDTADKFLIGMAQNASDCSCIHTSSEILIVNLMTIFSWLGV